MKPLLVTASLLNAWEWYRMDDKDTAETEFIRTLKREQTPDNPDMLAGRAFECRVRLINEQGREWYTARDKEDLDATRDREFDADYIDTAKEIARETSGGLWQVPLSEKVTLDGVHFLLYGRLDVLKLGVYDIKYSHTFETGKYLTAPQTRMYMTLASEAPWMKYMVSNGRNVFEDFYLRQDVEPIYPMVRDFWNWLETYPKFKSLYVENWESRGD